MTAPVVAAVMAPVGAPMAVVAPTALDILRKRRRAVRTSAHRNANAVTKPPLVDLRLGHVAPVAAVDLRLGHVARIALAPVGDAVAAVAVPPEDRPAALVDIGLRSARVARPVTDPLAHLRSPSLHVGRDLGCFRRSVAAAEVRMPLGLLDLLGPFDTLDTLAANLLTLLALFTSL